MALPAIPVPSVRTPRFGEVEAENQPGPGPSLLSDVRWDRSSLPVEKWEQWSFVQAVVSECFAALRSWTMRASPTMTTIEAPAMAAIRSMTAVGAWP